MQTLLLAPVEASPERMAALENQGLIIRLAPRNHETTPAPGEAIGTPVYRVDAAHGGHMLLACTINQSGFRRFGWHTVPEEFLLLGDPSRSPLYLAIFLGKNSLLAAKLADKTLQAEDFVCLKLRFNDPLCSFFTMNPFVPHGECVAQESATPPSFYVTEPSGTTLCKPEWNGYSIALGEEVGA